MAKYRLFFEASLQNKIEEIIKIDHAGELAAKYVYMGQLYIEDLLHKKNEEIHHMLECELKHLKYFEDTISNKNGVISPLSIFAKHVYFTLGLISSLEDVIQKNSNNKNKLTQTYAIEEIIEQHYNSQLKELQFILKNTQLTDDQKNIAQQLVENISHFVLEEIEHKNAHSTLNTKFNLLDKLKIKITQIIVNSGIKLIELT